MSEKRICLNQSVMDFMDERITPESTVLEFGSGYSSRWFADRCGKLVSYETSPLWYRTAKDECKGAPAEAEFVLFVIPGEAAGTGPYDLALVDCREELRTDAAKTAWGELRQGGWLVFDDAQRSKHSAAINWLNTRAEPVKLAWNAERDIPEAKKRLALAWQKFS